MPSIPFRLAAFALGLFAAAPLAAQEVDHARQYAACMRLAERDAEEAFESALAWRDMGGGPAAEHCIATALFRLGQYVEAAGRFETLANDPGLEPPLRADLFAHAGRAWLVGGNAPHAETALSAALGLAPEKADFLIDRAEARGAMERYQDAIADLDAALARDATRAEAYVFRASARRHLGDSAGAQADLDEALILDPGSPYALLERGILRQAGGDKDGARRDWLAVIEALPGTPAADSAQARLETMDVETPPAP